jgi:hypothetical protein
LSTGKGHRCRYLVIRDQSASTGLAMKGEYDTPANAKD